MSQGLSRLAVTCSSAPSRSHTADLSQTRAHVNVQLVGGHLLLTLLRGAADGGAPSLLHGSGSSWEPTSGGQMQKENLEAGVGGFPGPGLGLVSYYRHRVLLATPGSSGPTLLHASLRNLA